MTETYKLSRLAFSVIKLSIDQVIYYLMRRNEKWGDVSFVGGHEEHRDLGDLRRAARRELAEEVPVLRGFQAFNLTPMTPVISHGPLYSPSAQRIVRYELQFFLVQFETDPTFVIKSLGLRSRNMLIPEYEVTRSINFPISALVSVLNSSVRGGINEVSLSWPHDLPFDRAKLEQLQNYQLQFKLKN